MPAPIHINNKQLFLDDYLIESSCNIERSFHRPHITGDILLTIDQPWEAGAHLSLYCSVLQESGITRLWYGVESERLRHISYAEAEDGLHFNKPLLNLHEMGATRANNVVIPDPVAGGTPWIDPHSPPSQRYHTFVKAYPGWPDASQPTAFKHYASPDGLHWTVQPVEQIGDCDTQHIAFWDAQYKRYVLYTRRWTRFANKHLNFRSIRRLESEDLIHWEDTGIVWGATAEELSARPTPTQQPSLDYYGAAVFKYPETDGVYLGLAAAYWHWLERLEDEKWGESGDPQSAIIERLSPASMDVHLIFSRNGKTFQRLGHGAPFMAQGPAGRFDSRMVWALPQPIPVGEELWIYYIGSNLDHDGFIDRASPGRLSGLSRAVMRLDGFASLEASHQGGEFTTPTFTFTGDQLELNLDTSGGGCVRVELQDTHGQPIAGFHLAAAVPLCTNSTCAKVIWYGDPHLGSLAGTPIKMRWVLLDARVYAFKFVTRQ